MVKASGANGATQDLTTNFTPQGMIVMWTGQTADDTVEAQANYGIGFSDGTNNACVSCKSTDAQTTADAYRSHYNNRCIITYSVAAAGTIIQQASAEFITNGVRFTWHTNDANTNDFMIIVFAGVTNVKVGTSTLGTASTGTRDFTGLGFDPTDADSCLLTLYGDVVTQNSNLACSQLGFGAAMTSTKEWSQCNDSEDGPTTMDTWRMRSESSCMNGLIPTTGSLDYLTEFTSWITDGFRLTINDAPTTANTAFSYMVIKGASFDVGWYQPPNAGPALNQDVTVDVGGNIIRGIFLASIATTNDQVATTHNLQTYGAADRNGNMVYIATIDEDAGADSDNYRVQGTTKIQDALSLNGVEGNITVFDSFPDNSTFRYDMTNSGTLATQKVQYVVFADLGGGPQTIDRPVNDSYGVSDAVGRVGSHPRGIADTYNVTDAVNRVGSHPRNPADTYNVTDSVAKISSHPRGVADTVNVSDAVNKVSSHPRNIADNYNVSDAVNRVGSHPRNLGDSLDVNDSVERDVQNTRNPTEQYDVTDSLEKISSHPRNIEDTFNVSDAIEKVSQYPRPIDDTYNVTDAVNYTIERVRNVDDTYNITDAVARAQVLERLLTDIVDIDDSVLRQISLTRLLADTILIEENLVALKTQVAELADEYDVTDLQTNITNHVKNLSENYDILDSLIKNISVFKTLADTYGIEETLIVQTSLNRLVTDVYEVNDSLIRQVLLSRGLTEDYDVTDEIETEVIPSSNRITVNLEEEYNVSDSITKEQILQRLLDEAYNINDSLHVDGGQPPIVIDDHLNIKSSSSGTISQSRLRHIKKRMIKEITADLLPEAFPDKIFVNNQKAWFLNDKLEPQTKANRIVNTIGVKTTKYNQLRNHIKTTKELEDDFQLRYSLSMQEYNKQILTDYINTKIPGLIKLKGPENKAYSSLYLDKNLSINNSIHNNIGIQGPPNKTSNDIKLISSTYRNRVTNPILINNNNVLKHNTFSGKLGIDNYKNKKIKKNKVYSEVTTNKKHMIKELKNILIDKSYSSYETILKKLLKTQYDKVDEKEKLNFYLSYYQTRFDIEQTKTNKDMDKLDNNYKKKLEILYEQIVREYKDKLPQLGDAKQKYEGEVYGIIRKAAQDGYNIGIDYVTRATERDDVYPTQKDLDNVKTAADKAYDHFWQSVENKIKKIQKKESSILILGDDEQQNENNSPYRFDYDMALFMRTLTTSAVGLATWDKLYQMMDKFVEQNLQVKFVFATERDSLVCKYCIPLDYAFTKREYLANEMGSIPLPPIHLNCRCRILVKIGSRVIVK